MNKTMVGILVIFFFILASAQAKQKQQLPLPQQQSVDDMVTKLKTQLDLTENQVDEVKQIIENYLVQQQRLALEEKKQLRKVLTGDQMYSWEDLQKEVLKEKKKHAKL